MPKKVKISTRPDGHIELSRENGVLPTSLAGKKPSTLTANETKILLTVICEELELLDKSGRIINI